MIAVTAPNGNKFEIDADKISVVGPNVGYDPRAKSVIRVDGENHAVLETIEQIDKLRASK